MLIACSITHAQMSPALAQLPELHSTTRLDTRPRAASELHSTTRLDTRLDTRPRAVPELHSTTRLTPASSRSRSHPCELTARLCAPSRRAASASPGRRIPSPRPHCTRASMPRARRDWRWAHQRLGDGWQCAYLAHQRPADSEQSVHSPPTVSIPDDSAARMLMPAGSAREAAHRWWLSRSGRRAGRSPNGFPLPPRCLGASIGATASDRPTVK